MFLVPNKALYLNTSTAIVVITKNITNFAFYILIQYLNIVQSKQ